MLPCVSESCDAPCCDAHEVPLLDADVARLGAHTGLAASAFVDESGGWRLLKGAGVADGGCVFLGDVAPAGRRMRGCTVHEARPTACRTYPFVLRHAGPRPRVERDGLCPYRDAFETPPAIARELADLWRNLQEERRARLGP